MPRKVSSLSFAHNVVNVLLHRDGGAYFEVGGGGAENEHRRRELVWGSGGHPPPENFEI